MSWYDYDLSRFMEKTYEFTFNSLIMAAMRQADDVNLKALKHTFPDIWEELEARYNAPGGKLEHEINAENTGRSLDPES